MNDIETVVNEAPVESANTEVVDVPQISESSDAQEAQQQTEAHSEQNASEQPSENRFEKAFAARLAKEKAKLEAEITKKYSKHDYVLSKAAAENDMSVDEYLNTLEKDYRDKELSAIPKEIRDDVLWAREQRSKEQVESRTKAETEQWNTEVQGLLKIFPDIKSAKDIPDEVLEYRLKDSVPLEYAYARYALGKERTRIEQETLKKLRENETSSPGSMASSSTDTRLKISDMDNKEFEKIMEEVARGNRKSL